MSYSKACELVAKGYKYNSPEWKEAFKEAFDKKEKPKIIGPVEIALEVFKGAINHGVYPTERINRKIKQWRWLDDEQY